MKPIDSKPGRMTGRMGEKGRIVDVQARANRVARCVKPARQTQDALHHPPFLPVPPPMKRRRKCRALKGMT